jgi:fermentation-respiration switch protein FrsA (DUF1100 family)|nr:alpha/beta hydrolase [Candidatus Krumholzibacteria bacterium]
MRWVIFLSVFLLFFSGPGVAQDAMPVQLDTGTGVLHGTLLLPEEASAVPVVLILSGSGPTDRDGNTTIFPGKNNSLRQLAEGLGQQGIASLRFDKRGVGASLAAGLSEMDLRFEHYIEDATAWARWLQADPRFSSVTIAGHSEGSQIGANAAWLAGADGFVSLAGPGRPVFTLLKEQLAKQLPVRHRVHADQLMASLARGETVAEPPPELMILFRPSVQPYLISWQKFDPQVAIGRFDGPVAVVQGTTDIQVSVKDAELLAAAQPRARLVLLEGMNHLFKPVAEANPVLHQMSLVDSVSVFAPEAVAVVADVSAQAERYHRAKVRALMRLAAFNTDRVALPWPAPDLTTGQQVGFWARHFLDQGGQAYCFGLAEEGYVTRGYLWDDRAFDCISFLYRCTELARARDNDEALAWALRTRFSGADPDSVVDAQGRVDYDRPEHLDFSLDMIRSGIWGRDITAQLVGVVTDTVGTSRYPAGSFQYVDAESLDVDELREGDVVWMVLSPWHKDGAMLRQDYGLVIGHVGIVLVEGDQAYLCHAASKPLPGLYEKTGLVKVPLPEYLARVGKFAGVMVTRL